MTSRREYVVADVFTDTPLRGNAVAVFPDGAGLGGKTMQRAARELNLSETVFVLPPSCPETDARLRIFTPSMELPFAGHPMLGAGTVVSERLARGELAFETGIGVIAVRARPRGGGADSAFDAEMDQPVAAAEPFPREAELLAALGVERSMLPVEAYVNGPLHVYVALGDEHEVEALDPDLRALSALGAIGANCFARAGAEGKFKTRMFGPQLGVNEDPATGSAAGPLALHLVRHEWAGHGQALEFRQGEEIGRPSLLRARVEGAGGRAERVVVGGGVVPVAHGEYLLG